MCGITGITRFAEPVDKREIQGMTAMLSHRGPDGEGIWLDTNVAIGHRRLSIIDLETGAQPMCNEDGTLWITYNGELYNFAELRVELTQKGHAFRTHSDTEVIVHAYEEWGDACVERFRGMFAFGIVDTGRRRLFLARDHLGIKPLVYYADERCFAFASEIQALRAVSGVCLDLDLQAVDQYLWLQYIPAPRSVFRQVRKLPPAHRMSITFDGKVSGPESYWHIEFRPDHAKTECEWLEGLDEVLRNSVKAHLVADVPFGAFLSGGVDSSAVVAYMAQILDQPVKTFSIGFEEDAYSELKYADIAAKRWGAEHHVEIVKPDALSMLPDLVRHYGEPFGDSSAIPTYYVCKLARQHVPMVLSGDGGDEVFAGYKSYIAWLKYLADAQRPLWKRIPDLAARYFFPRRFPPVTGHDAGLENWLAFISYLPPLQRKRLWRKEWHSSIVPNPDLFEAEFSRTTSYSLAHKVQYMDMKTYLPFDILTKVDVASMMNSLEVRTPFVDKKVFEYAVRIPEKYCIAQDRQGGWQGKLILKKLMQVYYEPEFLNREKMGFAAPIKKWFAKDGSLYNYLNERFNDRDTMITEYFEVSTIRRLIKNNDSGPLWLLLFLEEWLQAQKKR